MNTNNSLKIKALKFSIVISFILVIIAGGCIILMTYMKYYKNPSEQKLIEAGVIEKTVKVGDVDFNYVEGQNNGPALLLLHAQTLDWFTYSKVLPALSKEFHIFAVDYPGHGKTIYPDNYPMTASQIGNDLANFIETAIGEPAYVTGNSSGGLLTVWLAANRPDLVKAVVLEDPPLFSSEYPEIKQTIADKLFTASYKAVQDKQYGGNFLDYWIENGTEFFRTYTGPLSQPLIKFVVSNYKKANPGKPVAIAFLPIVVQEMLRGLNYYDPRFGASFHEGTWNEGFDHADALVKIRCPALLIHAHFEIMEDGTLNGAMNQEQANRAVSLIPNCQYIKLDADHVTNLEVPDQFIQIIEGYFLSK
ncbi:MAG: alpha/beta hydrolase [Treponema sp.]|jgi:pimeloyl-ACP methyl ester carboxylesterase|nr:alpha/beta hydrolase [Treponema sp.]